MSDEFTSLNFLYKRQLTCWSSTTLWTGTQGNLIPRANSTVQFLIVELYNQKATQNAVGRPGDKARHEGCQTLWTGDPSYKGQSAEVLPYKEMYRKWISPTAPLHSSKLGERSELKNNMQLWPFNGERVTIVVWQSSLHPQWIHGNQQVSLQAFLPAL